MMRSSANSLIWRYATQQDCRQYFDWANDTGVRNNSFHSSAISWEDHQLWFASKVASDSLMFLFNMKSVPVGQVRIDWEADWGHVDFSVDSKYRGQGIGAQMLETVINQVKGSGHEGLVGIVKRTNGPSSRAFEKAGFVNCGTIEKNGFSCVRFEKTLK